MVLGRRVAAGTVLALPAAALPALIAAGAVLLATLPWYVLGLLALIPVAVRLPVPRSAPWLQAVVASVYTLAVAGAACALAWQAGRN
jgi:hypothetical protein